MVCVGTQFPSGQIRSLMLPSMPTAEWCHCLTTSWSLNKNRHKPLPTEKESRAEHKSEDAWSLSIWDSLSFLLPLQSYLEFLCCFVREFIVHEGCGMSCVLWLETQHKTGITSAPLPPCQRVKTVWFQHPSNRFAANGPVWRLYSSSLASLPFQKWNLWLCPWWTFPPCPGGNEICNAKSCKLENSKTATPVQVHWACVCSCQLPSGCPLFR